MELEQRLRAAQYRLAQHYLEKLRTVQRTYEQGNESAVHALALFDQEREQVRQWQAWVVAHAGTDEKAAILCSDYARACTNIYRLRLPPHEYLVLLETALEAARRRGDLRTEVAHLLDICELSEYLVEYRQAIDYSRQALAITRKLADRTLLAQALSVCGIAYCNQGNFAEAETYYRQSLALYQAIGNQRGMAKILSMLSATSLSLSNNAAAQDYLERGLVLNRAIGNQAGIAECLNNLGFLAIRHSNFTAASDYLEQALALHRAMDDKPGISFVLINLGNTAYYRENYVLARTYQEEALSLARANGLQEDEAICLYKLGQVTMAQDDVSGARDYFEHSLSFSRSAKIDTLVANTLSNLAIIYMLLQQEDLANTALREGMQIALSLSVIQIRLGILVSAARMWILKGEAGQAATWLGLVENHPHPAVQMADIKRGVQLARAECLAVMPLEQFAAAWEMGKQLDLDTVIADILHELSPGSR